MTANEIPDASGTVSTSWNLPNPMGSSGIAVIRLIGRKISLQNRPQVYGNHLLLRTCETPNECIEHMYWDKLYRIGPIGNIKMREDSKA
jgi:hypothetical protein